jgi:Tfp pilus assembly protein PilN
MAVQEEIQRLRTRIAELEREKQVADELQQPGEQYQILFNTLIEIPPSILLKSWAMPLASKWSRPFRRRRTDASDTHS